MTMTDDEVFREFLEIVVNTLREATDEEIQRFVANHVHRTIKPLDQLDGKDTTR